MHTPWGKAQSVTELGQGVLKVSCAGHGGIYVPQALLSRIPERYQLWAERWTHSRRWYEEDCCWAAVAVSLPELFTAKELAHANSILSSYGPDSD